MCLWRLLWTYQISILHMGRKKDLKTNTFLPGIYEVTFKLIWVFMSDYKPFWTNDSNQWSSLEFVYVFAKLLLLLYKLLIDNNIPCIEWTHFKQSTRYWCCCNHASCSFIFVHEYTFSSIHPRDKFDVAQRLALSGRAVAYGEKNIVYQGPFPSMYTLTENKLTIEYDSGNSLIEVRSAEGFEVRLVSLCLAFRTSNYRIFFKTMALSAL